MNVCARRPFSTLEILFHRIEDTWIRALYLEFVMFVATVAAAETAAFVFAICLWNFPPLAQQFSNQLYRWYISCGVCAFTRIVFVYLFLRYCAKPTRNKASKYKRKRGVEIGAQLANVSVTKVETSKKIQIFWH